MNKAKFNVDVQTIKKSMSVEVDEHNDTQFYSDICLLSLLHVLREHKQKYDFTVLDIEAIKQLNDYDLTNYFASLSHIKHKLQLIQNELKELTTINLEANNFFSDLYLQVKELI